ncbi:MAG: molybdopterin molybdenumtransferase MoeA [Actinophytocola sp.]|nr:molybdopterin molybdenumtransferase MoeA [Actinophytocola sp.]
MNQPIAVDDHAAAVAELLPQALIDRLPLERCHGLVLAEDVAAAVSLPSFDNSAMDGYAVRAADIAAATAAHPVELPVDEDIPAGRTDVPPLKPGRAHRIMTGAPMPNGADTVVRVEDTDAGTERVRISVAAEQGKSVRYAGEDVQRGELTLREGTVLGAAHLGLAAASGRHQLAVRVPLRVLVVSTGTELVTAPEPLRHGQIYESNSIMLASAMRALGCEVRVVRSVADDVERFMTTLAEHSDEVDLIVTSGGVSAGAYEVVKDALAENGVRFTKVAMQPGGPQGCGRALGVPIVTLPGNPVSVLVSYEVFLRPALLAAHGHGEVSRPAARARLLEPLQAPSGKRQFRRGYYVPANEDTAGRVTGTVGPRGGPGSHLLAAFTQANCLIVIDEETTTLAEGDEVDVLLLS